MNASAIPVPGTRAGAQPAAHDRPGHETGALIVGVSGVRRNAAVAACVRGRLIAFCEQERVTRVRGVRLERSGVPAEAMAAVLALARRRSTDVERYAVAEEEARLPADLRVARIDHHEAHAACAFHLSAFEQAAVLVCDRHTMPPASVWAASQSGLRRQEWDAGVGLASLYSECARIFDVGDGQEHRLEGLARLDPGEESDRLRRVWSYSNGAVLAQDGWPSIVADWLGERRDLRHRARVAAACQRRLGELLLELARDVRAAVDVPRLCVGGGLFYNTYFTTLLRQHGAFDDVFVAPNPGNAGVAAGAALAASPSLEAATEMVSPFLGPEFDVEETKATLDNCKLSYERFSESDTIGVAVEALRKGHLVAWFQGRMEWAHRALGNRSILASPCSPYALENLNVFLKQRERHRAYGVSVPEAMREAFFSGPPRSRFMEFEYALNDRDRLRHILPESTTALRVQTVPDGDQQARRFHLLHTACGDATGVPVLVNTSFNGFSEPMVCSPRDAIRVFFGTGLDMLVLDRFVLRK